MVLLEANCDLEMHFPVGRGIHRHGVIDIEFQSGLRVEVIPQANEVTRIGSAALQVLEVAVVLRQPVVFDARQRREAAED